MANFISLILALRGLRQALGKFIPRLDIGFGRRRGFLIFAGLVGTSREQKQESGYEHQFHRGCSILGFELGAITSGTSDRGSASRQRKRLLQIAFPTSKPGPIGIDIVLRTTTEAGVNCLAAPSTRFSVSRLRFSAATALLARFRVHCSPRILRPRVLSTQV